MRKEIEGNTEKIGVKSGTASQILCMQADIGAFTGMERESQKLSLRWLLVRKSPIFSPLM